MVQPPAIFLWPIQELAASPLPSTHELPKHVVLVICQDFLIVYGTVHRWQWNQIIFLITKKGVGQSLSDVPLFSSFLGLAQKLESKCNGKKKKSFQNCPYKSMWICVCTHMEWVYCLEQLSSWERKLSSLQSMAVWNHLHHNNLTSAIFAFVVLQNTYQLLLDSWAVLSSAKRPKEQSH